MRLQYLPNYCGGKFLVGLSLRKYGQKELYIDSIHHQSDMWGVGYGKSLDIWQSWSARTDREITEEMSSNLINTRSTAPDVLEDFAFLLRELTIRRYGGGRVPYQHEAKMAIGTIVAVLNQIQKDSAAGRFLEALGFKVAIVTDKTGNYGSCYTYVVDARLTLLPAIEKLIGPRGQYFPQVYKADEAKKEEPVQRRFGV